MIRVHISPSAKERRLIHRYKSHIERFVATTEDYKWSNPLEAVAGFTHVITAGVGLDPAARQGLSYLDGSYKEGVPDYAQYYGRTIENTVGFVGNLIRLRIPSAVGNVINVPGDFAADTADALSGAAQRRGNLGNSVSYADQALSSSPDLSSAPMRADIAAKQQHVKHQFEQALAN